jgi:hypothetical protein
MKKPKYKYSEDIFPEDTIDKYNPFYTEDRETLPNQNSSNPFYEETYNWNNFRQTKKNKNRTSKSFDSPIYSNLFKPKQMVSKLYTKNQNDDHTYKGKSQRKGNKVSNVKQDFVVNHIFNINSLNINQVYDNYTLNKMKSNSNKGKLLEPFSLYLNFLVLYLYVQPLIRSPKQTKVDQKASDFDKELKIIL